MYLDTLSAYPFLHLHREVTAQDSTKKVLSFDGTYSSTMESWRLQCQLETP